MRTMATSILCRGKSIQAATPIQIMAICTAPEGAVYSMVSNLS